MRKTLAWVAASVGLLVTSGIVLVAPSGAQASTGNYCGTLVQPYTACSGTSGLTWTADYGTWNEAYYSGNGYISVCQKIISNDLGQISRTCNPVDCYCNYSNSGVIDDPLDYVTGYVGNNSAYAHTINGDLVFYAQ